MLLVNKLLCRKFQRATFKLFAIRIKFSTFNDKFQLLKFKFYYQFEVQKNNRSLNEDKIMQSIESVTSKG